jgi:propanol-preferring alcohol dehydrogenase
METLRRREGDDMQQDFTLPDRMLAMVLDAPGKPLQPRMLPLPAPAAGQVLIRVGACGVCRTDLHIADGELPSHKLPLVPGHEVAGTVVRTGAAVTRLQPGQRVGVPWLSHTCGHCAFCRMHRENLCDHALFTGYDIDGGYAAYAVADAGYCIALPDRYDDLHAAPLLCAGLIGFRAYSMMQPQARRLGIYGFGAAAHIVAQVARHEGREVFAFTRPGDRRSQAFALSLGASWAGDAAQPPPAAIDAALIFAPSGALVPAALAHVRKGGDVICAGIHMSDIPSFPYSLLWGERQLRSVANLTRADGDAFFRFAAAHAIDSRVVPYPLEKANEALDDLRSGRFDGAAVLVPGGVMAPST